jgi:dTDP-4-dehydrorhamnose reductase
MMVAMRWSRRKHLMLVTGASGFLGRHLVGSDATRDWEVVAPSSRMLDITRAELVATTIREWKPTAVVHLAYRRDDPRVIVQGSANVARAAAAAGAHLVHLSTDVVFGGRPRPYTEADTPDPVTDYGRWKADAEAQVTAAHPGAALVRTSLIYGTEHLAPVQRDVESALGGHGSMSFFTDEIRCPVHASDLARAVSLLADRRDLGGPLHVAGPEAIDRASLARLVARWLGADAVRIAGLRTSTVAESGLVRPACVVLDTSLATSLGLACRPVSEVLRS